MSDERVTGLGVEAVASDCTDGSCRRSIGQATLKDGKTGLALYEWVGANLDDSYLRHATEYIAEGRPEEARTLKVDSTIPDDGHTIILYNCPPQHHMTDLHHMMLTIPKPSAQERRALALIIATETRSLYVHYRLPHPALRTKSFVFLKPSDSMHDPNIMSDDDLVPLDLKPYILDWGRIPSPRDSRPTTEDMFQHPRVRDEALERTLWFNQAWAMLMIMSEIAEWKPLDKEEFRDNDHLQEVIQRRIQLVTDASWKRLATASMFRYGFDFLNRDYHTLRGVKYLEAKRFFDRIYKSQEPIPASAPQ